MNQEFSAFIDDIISPDELEQLVYSFEHFSKSQGCNLPETIRMAIVLGAIYPHFPFLKNKISEAH